MTIGIKHSYLELYTKFIGPLLNIGGMRGEQG